jgi:SpoIIAA-like
MLTAEFNENVLVVRPEGAITSADVTALEAAANGYLATHPKIPGVMIETRSFPGFASLGAFSGYVRFVLSHRARVRRIALVTNSMLTPIAKFMANHVVGVEMRHYPFGKREAALDWLRT